MEGRIIQMNLNICMCGAQDGYLHHEDCPFPYFGNDTTKIAVWIKQNTDRRKFRLENECMAKKNEEYQK